jgi:hypothetical protein
MRISVLCAAVSLVAVTAFSAPLPPRSQPKIPTPPAKERTIKELIDLALRDGVPGQIHRTQAKDLGYSDLHKQRMIFYLRQDKPKKHSSSLSVLTKDEMPFSLIWIENRIDYGPSGKKKIEMWQYRSTPSGALEQAAIVFGDENRIQSRSHPIDKSVQEKFAALKSFLLKDAVGMIPTRDK